jgi:nucleoside-diphosphate-sugar epimerase
LKILFIGGTGVISEGVSRVAAERGFDLYLLNRGSRSILVPENARLIQADYSDPGSVAAALKGQEFDAVVNWIAFTPEQVKKDIALFSDHTGQYFFISSASAYQKPVQHYLITEATPLANPYWQYSRDKIACEELLMHEFRTNGFPVTIVRPSLTYGNTMIPVGVSCWRKPWTVVDRIRKGKKIIVHGDGTSLWVMTHNTDLAQGLLGLIGNRDALGEAFQITSDEVLTWNQIYEEIGQAAGRKPEVVHIPSDFLAAVLPDAMGSLIGDKAQSVVFDNRKIKRYVPGFQPAVSFAEGLRRSIAWFEAHPEYCEVDEAWNGRIDRIVAEYEAALQTAIAKLGAVRSN